MTRLFYTNPIAAVKAANKYEALGFVVELSVDGDVIIIALYRVEEARYVA